MPVFYPGVMNAQAATLIAVSSGATIGGVDISVGAGVLPARHIRGRVLDAATGQPVAGARVMAHPRNPDPLFSIVSMNSDSNGGFDLAGLVPGSYVVMASNRAAHGIVFTDVGEKDLENIPVVVRALFTISGRFIFDDLSRAAADPMTRFPLVRLTRDPQMLALPPAGPTFAPPPQPDGSFRLEGVSPGDFRISLMGLPENAYVKSIKLGNADVLDGGLHLYAPPDNALEIVIGVNAGNVQGAVVNSRLEPLPNRTVALVPQPRLRHRSDLYRTIASDSAGRFRLQGLTPGSYTMFAWDDVETGAWQDPDFIRGHENRGAQIQVKEGVEENIQLTVIP